MERFSKNVMHILGHMGWYQGRSTSTKEAVQMLTSIGYSVTDSFTDFYSEFGDFLISTQVNENDRIVDFRVATAFGVEFDVLIVHYYPRFIGCKNLVLIGTVDEVSTLAIDENGYCYMLLEKTVTILGKKDATLESLLNIPWKELNVKSDTEWWKMQDIDWKKVRSTQIDNYKYLHTTYPEKIK